VNNTEREDGEALGAVILAKVEIIDAAEHARELYGEHADNIAGRKLPEHDYRFRMTTKTGARCTFHAGSTAGHIMEWLAREKGRKS
jgi:hypothetical protein